MHGMWALGSVARHKLRGAHRSDNTCLDVSGSTFSRVSCVREALSSVIRTQKLPVRK